MQYRTLDSMFEQMNTSGMNAAMLFAAAARPLVSRGSTSSSEERVPERGATPAAGSLVGAVNRENECEEAASCGLRGAREDSHSTCATGSQSSAASASARGGGAGSASGSGSGVGETDGGGGGGAGGRESARAASASFDCEYSERVVAPSTAENNALKWLEYRSQRLAAFSVGGRDLLCLPQAFEAFLKHLVGGLHTVYTKLKRLEVTPVICNVEQVRLLRQVGAIQAGVNRCKLIAPSEFDILYDDCTNATCASLPRPAPPPLSPPPGPSLATPFSCRLHSTWRCLLLYCCSVQYNVGL